MSQPLRSSPRPPAPSYDAVVVGAHPAGAATAMLLARRGWSTLLLHRNGLSDDRFVTSPMQRGAALLLAPAGVCWTPSSRPAPHPSGGRSSATATRRR